MRQRAEADSAFALPEIANSEPLIHSSTLRYLNTHWAIEPPVPLVAGRSALRNRVAARIVRLLSNLLAPYFEQERDFFAHIVRMQNSMATNYDELVEHSRKLAEAVRLESQRLANRDQLLHDLLETRLKAVERTLDKVQQQA